MTPPINQTYTHLATPTGSPKKRVTWFDQHTAGDSPKANLSSGLLPNTPKPITVGINGRPQTAKSTKPAYFPTAEGTVTKLRSTVVANREIVSPDQRSTPITLLVSCSNNRFSTTRNDIASTKSEYVKAIQMAEAEYDRVIETAKNEYNVIVKAAEDKFTTDIKMVEITHQTDRFTQDSFSALDARITKKEQIKHTKQLTIVTALITNHTKNLVAEVNYTLKELAAELKLNIKMSLAVPTETYLDDFLNNLSSLKFGEVERRIELIFADTYAKATNASQSKLNTEIQTIFLERFHIDTATKIMQLRQSIFDLIGNFTTHTLNGLPIHPEKCRAFMRCAHTRGIVYSTT